MTDYTDFKKMIKEISELFQKSSLILLTEGMVFYLI